MREPNGWTVERLIEYLEECDPEAKVLFAYSSGDYWGSEVASEPDEVIEDQVVWSEYHRTWKVVSDEDDEDDEVDERHDVVVIR
jgi:hypothetical protein